MGNTSRNEDWNAYAAARFGSSVGSCRIHAKSRSMYTNAVVADGSLRIAYEKGEVKRRYWNPRGMFDSVHVIVLADEDIEANKVQRVAGDAELTIHPVGKFQIFNAYDLRRKICERINAIKPDIVRGHGQRSVSRGTASAPCDAMLRVSEAAALHVADLEAEGGNTLTVRRSKTDQEGEGVAKRYKKVAKCQLTCTPMCATKMGVSRRPSACARSMPWRSGPACSVFLRWSAGVPTKGLSTAEEKLRL